MDKTYVVIAVKVKQRETLKECKKEYVKHHPEMGNVKITDDKIIYEIMKYYLNN
jgi:spore coat protein CotF